MTTLPTEDEIRAVAEELGLLDENGQVPRDKRSQLAAVAVKMRALGYEPKEPDGPEPLTTAQALSKFYEELAEERFTPSVIVDIIRATVPALIARDGLIINEENRTP